MINNKLIQEYKNYIYAHTHVTEGYLKSDKTISVNLHKFESKEKNILLIIGVCGSGKTTLGKYLSKKYKCKYIGTDSCWMQIDEEYQGSSENIRWKKFLKCIHKELVTKKRIIFEGINIMDLWDMNYQNTKSYIEQQPIIILGNSALISGLKAIIRNIKEKKSLEGLYDLIKENLKTVQKTLSKFREHRIKQMGAIVKEYKIPKL